MAKEITLDIDKKFMRDLARDLGKNPDAKGAMAETLSEAFTLYAFAVKQQSEGRVLLSVDTEERLFVNRRGDLISSTFIKPDTARRVTLPHQQKK
jgi:hypothetical protein